MVEMIYISHGLSRGGGALYDKQAGREPVIRSTAYPLLLLLPCVILKAVLLKHVPALWMWNVWLFTWKFCESFSYYFLVYTVSYCIIIWKHGSICILSGKCINANCHCDYYYSPKFHSYNQQLNYIHPTWLGWGFGAFMNAYDGCPFKLSKAETLI